MANSDYLADLIMERVLLAFDSLYVSLHGGDPGRIGAGEVQGLGYKRQQIGFAKASPRAVGNRDAIHYDDLPQSDLSHFGVWDASASGHYLTGGLMEFPLSVRQGQSLRWRANELLLTI